MLSLNAIFGAVMISAVHIVAEGRRKPARCFRPNQDGFLALEVAPAMVAGEARSVEDAALIILGSFLRGCALAFRANGIVRSATKVLELVKRAAAEETLLFLGFARAAGAAAISHVQGNAGLCGARWQINRFAVDILHFW